MARTNTGDRERPWRGTEQEKRAQVVVIDDHTVFRQALVMVLEHRGGFHVCAEAGSLAEARRAIGELAVGPDLVILDLDLRCRGTEELARELCDGPSGTGVIGLTADRDLGAVMPGKARVLGTDVAVDEILAAARHLVG